MKSTITIIALAVIAYMQAHPNFAKLVPTSTKADSTIIVGYVDVPAKIPVRVKVPARNGYKNGQRVMCMPYFSIASNRMDNLFTPDKKGSFPVIVVKP